jgi:hypothetical protein
MKKNIYLKPKIEVKKITINFFTMDNPIEVDETLLACTYSECHSCGWKSSCRCTRC